MKEEYYCLGRECPNRNQCLRHTHMIEGKRKSKCTNMRDFMQDKEKINRDSLRR